MFVGWEGVGLCMRSLWFFFLKQSATNAGNGYR